MKRILILISVASIVISLFAVTAFATDTTANGYTVIDYNDYISNLKVDGDNDIVTVTFPDDMYSTTQTDINGTSYKRGIIRGDLYMVSNYSGDPVVNACVNCPGGAVGNNYLDLSNIPDGAVFTTTNKVTLDSRSTGSWIDFKLNYRSRIAYYDEDFKLIEQQSSPLKEKAYDSGIWDYELVYEIAFDKPDTAKYCFTYFYFQVASFAERDDIAIISYDFEKPKLTMSISSLYRLQEQTGKTNQILGNIEDTLNGEAKPVAPENSESVGDLSDLEDSLTTDTEQGREEAEIVFNESSDIILSHIQGFFFLGMVVEWFMGVGWLRGILTVSLSLGIFAFIVNIASNLGKSIEHRSKGKAGKGG